MKASRHRLLLVTFGVAAIALASMATLHIMQKLNGNQPIEVDLKEMSQFDLDQQAGVVADIPRRFPDLEGKRVSFVCGVWAPAVNNDGSLSSFQAVYSKNKSSLSGPPVAQDFWDCVPLPNAKIFYFDGSVKVIGVFHIKIQKNMNGSIKSIYHVDVESVQPVDGNVP